MRVWILGGGLALALTAAASKDDASASPAATSAADGAPRAVTLRWQTGTIEGGKDAALPRALASRGAGFLTPPPAAPLRAWRLPDGSEVIAHEPPAELSRQPAGEQTERPE